ncbi:MAG: TetR/AcrR family transcriptional regulator [Saprospiraceae bacterium]|nr:TetR/AcrR family transcriptional regulator [Saprospiraceae bacterium]
MKTRERIVEVAIRLFNAEGINAVGVREIARTLGISPGNLSYHFPRKEDLLVEMLTRVTAGNDRHFQKFREGRPSCESFLQVMEQVFRNQYRYRGIFLAQEEMRRIFREFYDYRAVEKRRKDFLREFFSDLVVAGELKAEAGELAFLGAFTGFLGRFWILEAFFTQDDRSEDEAVRHYLGMLAWQLHLLATEAGKKGLEKYLLYLQA